MYYYKINNAKVDFSRFIFGCWQLSKKGWKSVNLDEARETLHMAYENGITTFDTAPIYGFGNSEKILGEELSHVRSEINISTKCGLFWENGRVFHDNRADSIEKQINESLKRLKTDYLDIVFVHWPDKNTQIEHTLERLFLMKEQNIVKLIGLSNFTDVDIHKIIHEFEIDVVQNKYNILERQAETEVLPVAIENKIKFWAYSPLAQGMLTNNVDTNYIFQKSDVRKFNSLFSFENMEKSIAKRKNLGNNPVKKSLEFLIANKNVSSIIIGVSKKTHLTENLHYFIK